MQSRDKTNSAEDPEDLGREDAMEMLEISRKAISEYIKYGNIPDKKICRGKYARKAGIFVTIKKNGELRGCIGFPRPVYTICEALIRSSIYSATEDPRFGRVREEELDSLQIEITVLGNPEIIDQNKENFLDLIEIGRDGLIIETDYASGLLLPQVAVEENFTKEEFLSATCLKAGLDGDCWKRRGTRIYRFPGRVIS